MLLLHKLLSFLVHRELTEEEIERIEQYTAEGKEAFLSNPMIQDATIRRLQTLAESTQRLSDELKARATEIDWRGISGRADYDFSPLQLASYI